MASTAGTKRVSSTAQWLARSCSRVLAVANFLADKPWQNFEIDIPSLMEYLKNAHDYFLGFSLPTIRRKLIEALPTAGYS